MQIIAFSLSIITPIMTEPKHPGSVKCFTPINLKIARGYPSLFLLKMDGYTMLINNEYKKKANASITVEASLVLPIFIYAVVAFLYFLQILLIQENIQSAITQTGQCASQYGFIYDYIKNYEENDNHKEEADNHEEETDNHEEETDDYKEEKNSKDTKYKNVFKEYINVKDLGEAAFFHLKLREYINETLIDSSCIIGGMNGISLMESKFMEQNDIVEISAIYILKIPVPLFGLRNIPAIQSVKLRAFTGYKPINYQAGNKGESNLEDKIVYITRTGSVYHLKRDCTFIKFNISQTTLQETGEKRNDNGGKYYACESCTRNKHLDAFATVYITSDGNRYHDTLSCSRLKRSVIEILLSKVQGRKPCSRCGSH